MIRKAIIVSVATLGAVLATQAALAQSGTSSPGKSGSPVKKDTNPTFTGPFVGAPFAGPTGVKAGQGPKKTGPQPTPTRTPPR